MAEGMPGVGGTSVSVSTGGASSAGTITRPSSSAPDSPASDKRRVGTPGLATRGLQVEDFTEIGDLLATALTPEFETRRGELAERATAIADRYPLYAHLGSPAAV